MRLSIILSLSVWFSFFYSVQSFSQKLVWSDEFETDGLPDNTKWSYDVGDHGWGNNELQFYSKEDLKNARVENGILIVEARADSSFPKGYSSARLVT